ncbi:sulfotransferase family 2 domain-containing protein [Primorskyibacter aestuariivivens]|uniref:sulfotransferase family 2 domain-containing protein n=1 Tax=Primorskyibacter aestuariivivens TaxID=1888912 RepID=UPI002301854A|nr:sulfotransferase family 2 domain-containing protein [Primorskyibacter aestuariivivens]MDA7429598.1 sulfotransferase family 2 domain-containing protein [Primorskyibacter aestuariivivens]
MYKFIYLKTIKTGGTSTEVFFQGAIEAPGAVIIDATQMRDDAAGIVGFRGDVSQLDEPPRWFNHMPAAAVKQKLDADIWQDYTKIGNIRNPFSRAVSAFYQQHRAGRFEMPEDFVDAKDLFSRFVKSENYRNYKHIVFIGPEFVLDEVIFYERLEQDISRVCSALSFDQPLERLPHYKKTTALHSEQQTEAFFTKDTADAVKTKEGWCFDRFGYSLDPAYASELPASASKT